MQITLEHPFCNVKKQVTALCKPLFTHTPFRYFDYDRYYFDGSYLTLNSETEFLCEIFNKKLLPTLDELHSNTSHYVFLSTSLPILDILQNDKFAQNIVLGEDLKVYHRLYLMVHSTYFVEAFGFGMTKPIKNFVEVFMNYLPILEKFSSYFREAASELISQLEYDKPNFDTVDDPHFFTDIAFKTSDSYSDFLNDIKLKKYKMHGKNGSCTLSAREFECLLWSAKDKNAKQIGQILSLSDRTVESYLLHVKNKLGCDSKRELIEIALNNPVIKSFLK